LCRACQGDEDAPGIYRQPWDAYGLSRHRRQYDSPGNELRRCLDKKGMNHLGPANGTLERLALLTSSDVQIPCFVRRGRGLWRLNVRILPCAKANGRYSIAYWRHLKLHTSELPAYQLAWFIEYANNLDSQNRDRKPTQRPWSHDVFIQAAAHLPQLYDVAAKSASSSYPRFPAEMATLFDLNYTLPSRTLRTSLSRPSTPPKTGSRPLLRNA